MALKLLRRNFNAKPTKTLPTFYENLTAHLEVVNPVDAPILLIFILSLTQNNK